MRMRRNKVLQHRMAMLARKSGQHGSHSHPRRPHAVRVIMDRLHRSMRLHNSGKRRSHSIAHPRRTAKLRMDRLHRTRKLPNNGRRYTTPVRWKIGGARRTRQHSTPLLSATLRRKNDRHPHSTRRQNISRSIVRLNIKNPGTDELSYEPF